MSDTTTILNAFASGDPVATIAHALAIGDMWTPEQWNAAVALVAELRLQGLLAPAPSSDWTQRRLDAMGTQTQSAAANSDLT